MSAPRPRTRPRGGRLLQPAGPGAALASELEGVRGEVVEASRGGKPNAAEVGAVLSFSEGTVTVTSPARRR